MGQSASHGGREGERVARLYCEVAVRKVVGLDALFKSSAWARNNVEQRRTCRGRAVLRISVGVNNVHGIMLLLCDFIVR